MTNSVLAPVLIVSASDSSCAAGLQVDIRALQTFGVSAKCAVTAITVQGVDGVYEAMPASTSSLEKSIISAATESPGISAIKIGMIPDAAIARSVAKTLADIEIDQIPVVVDPVISSTSGNQLLDRDGLLVLLEKIIPHATVISPNVHELTELGRLLPGNNLSITDIVHQILMKGTGSVLLTGGDTEENTCIDTLFAGIDQEPAEFMHIKRQGMIPRGTGCALSTVLSLFLARGIELETAIAKAIDHVLYRIDKSSIIGGDRLLFPSRVD